MAKISTPQSGVPTIWGSEASPYQLGLFKPTPWTPRAHQGSIVPRSLRGCLSHDAEGTACEEDSSLSGKPQSCHVPPDGITTKAWSFPRDWRTSASWGTFWGPCGSPQTSQQCLIGGVQEGCPELYPHYAKKRQPLRQSRDNFFLPGCPAQQGLLHFPCLGHAWPPQTPRCHSAKIFEGFN